MNLRQLRYISEVARRGLNVTAAANALYTSQPGISKQIRQLEDELGVEIFERRGKQVTRITEVGKVILNYAGRALVEIESLREAAQEYRDPQFGSLTLATTQTQARYRLPSVLSALREKYPALELSLQQGTPEQIARLVLNGAADFAIATEAMEHFEDLVMLPCFHWQRAIVVPEGHPLTEAATPLALADVARFPLATYVFGFDDSSPLDRAFKAARLTPQIGFTATDADVIKTYVRLGMGVGLVARMAFDPEFDHGLVMLDAGHLFEAGTASIGLRRGAFLRGYMYDFIALFAPHLTQELVDTALAAGSRNALRSLFVDLKLPTY